MLTFQKHKAHNILNMMLDLHFKGRVKVGDPICWEGKTLCIIGEYDKYMLFPLLVHA
jgi:hypothetical protein